MRVDISFEERQQIGLEILDEIQRVSSILNIKFYLAYGTLLGAIRHKGYIPWDDDIDIWMMREDFELFVQEFNDITSSNFKLLSYHTDENYPFIVTKVVSTKTHAEEKLMKPIKDLGIWVDVFPIDYLSPSNAANTEKLMKLEHQRWVALYKQSTLTAKIKLFFYNMIQKDTTWKDSKKKPGAITKEINKLSSCSTPNDICRSPASDLSMIVFLASEDFKSQVFVPFEDRIFPIPSGYDRLLKNIYNDYMKLPSKRKRKIDQHLRVAKWKK